jgi:diguanylate cyclase (GGDEF)-like protein
VFKSIKGPVGIIITVSLSLMALLVLWLAVSEHKITYVASAKEHASTYSEAVATMIQPHMTDVNLPEEFTQTIVSLFSTNDHFIGARIYNSDATLIKEQAGRVGQRLIEPFFQQADVQALPEGSSYDQHAIAVRHTIGEDIYPDGYLVLFFDTKSSVSSGISSLLWQIFPLVFAFWLFCVLCSLYWIHRLLKPLTNLTSFTHSVIETKDYALRNHLVDNNEVGALGDSINRLLEMIEVELLINHEQKQILIEQQDEMSRLANYDSLTGLPNRQFVLDNLKLELARAKRNNDDLALLFFDLDGFKGINDSLGHETGDLILIEVADRVSDLVREGDLVARLGGDEFLILPDRDVRDASIESLASRLIAAFEQPFNLRGLSLTVGVSVGIAKAADAHYNLSELMSNADLAMYRSKAKGRGSFTVFTLDMVASHKRKLHLANAIEQSLSQNEFEVYYQVKVNKHAEIVGLEALLRWEHPEFGMVMPSEFIPIAEQGGKISAITQWVIERVSEDLPRLRQWLNKRFRVSINLSGHDLRNSHLFDNIYTVFQSYQVNPEYVEFEVTESAYLENFALSNKFFKRMSNMGCAIALDDFGTGYSSLSYLTQISIDTLKIDKQFIRELETSERSQLVTGAIIDLAKRLSLSVCAEGIEGPFQWQYLTEHGCDQIQGYMFSKPVSLSTLLEMPAAFDVAALVNKQ